MKKPAVVVIGAPNPKRGNRTIDRFDEREEEEDEDDGIEVEKENGGHGDEDRDGNEEVKSTSEFSQAYPEGSTVGMKLPRAGTFRSMSVGSSSAWGHQSSQQQSQQQDRLVPFTPASGTSDGFDRSSESCSEHYPEGASSTRGVKSSRESVVSGMTNQAVKSPNNSFAMSSPSSVKGMKSPNGMADTSSRATTPRTLSDGKLVPVQYATTQVDGELGSFMDLAPSSGSDDGEGNLNAGVVFAAARQARLNRPQLGEHQTSSAMRLSQLLEEEHGAGLGAMNGGSRAGKVLGEELEALKGLQTATPQKDAPEKMALGQDKEIPRAGEVGNAEGPGIWQDHRKTLPDGLRSNPVRRSATLPVRKKTSFMPPPVDTKLGHRFLRQSVVATPYPTERRKPSWISAASMASKTGEIVPEAVLTVVLYDRSNAVPRMGKVVVPRCKKSVLDKNGTEMEKDGVNVMPISEFDDEKLFNLVRAEYSRMRGSFRKLISARSLQSVSLVSYGHLSQLSARHETPVHKRSFRVVNGVFAETHMLGLYREPRNGRGHRQWVEWVGRLPGNAGEDFPKSEKTALEFIEGWCVGKIATAVVCVITASLAATLLWIFLGVGGQTVRYGDVAWSGAPGIDKQQTRYRGAVGRVETGIALGVLVMMFGWTGIGAWIFLSWLVT